MNYYDLDGRFIRDIIIFTKEKYILDKIDIILLKVPYIEAAMPSTQRLDCSIKQYLQNS